MGAGWALHAGAIRNILMFKPCSVPGGQTNECGHHLWQTPCRGHPIAGGAPPAVAKINGAIAYWSHH